jgi:hypothetical protein
MRAIAARIGKRQHTWSADHGVYNLQPRQRLRFDETYDIRTPAEGRGGRMSLVC